MWRRSLYSSALPSRTNAESGISLNRQPNEGSGTTGEDQPPTQVHKVEVRVEVDLARRVDWFLGDHRLAPRFVRRIAVDDMSDPPSVGVMRMSWRWTHLGYSGGAGSASKPEVWVMSWRMVMLVLLFWCMSASGPGAYLSCAPHDTHPSKVGEVGVHRVVQIDASFSELLQRQNRREHLAQAGLRGTSAACLVSSPPEARQQGGLQCNGASHDSAE
jgi:hypothetical protein